MSQRCLIIPLPVTPIERLAAQFRSFIHLPDCNSLSVLMGSVAANMIEGPPCWLMMVGPPSCGKSELLNSLLLVPGMVEAADIGSEAAFLSGSPARDVAKDATGGLLRQIGDAGGLILNDFTSIISKPHDKMLTIMAILRECYGGRWTRHIGGEGGRAINWTGKLGLFAGCTGRIDQQHQISAELGERWIYHRYEEREGDDHFAECSMALSNRPQGWREDLNRIVRLFFDELQLSFLQPRPRRVFTQSERLRLHELAMVAVRCRSGVSRDNYSKEIAGSREAELAVRLSAVLAQLLLGMEAVGVSKAARWRLLGKVAMDSMPSIRRIIVQAIAREPESVEQLQQRIRCSLSVVKRVVEDLEVHEVVRREHGKVLLSRWMDEHYPKLFKPRP